MFSGCKKKKTEEKTFEKLLVENNFKMFVYCPSLQVSLNSKKVVYYLDEDQEVTCAKEAFDRSLDIVTFQL